MGFVKEFFVKKTMKERHEIIQKGALFCSRARKIESHYAHAININNKISRISNVLRNMLEYFNGVHTFVLRMNLSKFYSSSMIGS